MSDKGWHILAQLNLGGCCSKPVINSLQGFVLARWKKMSAVSQKDARWMAWSRAPQPATSMLQSKGLLLICGVTASWQGPAPAAVPALPELFPVPGTAGGMLNTRGSVQAGGWLCLLQLRHGEAAVSPSLQQLHLHNKFLGLISTRSALTKPSLCSPGCSSSPSPAGSTHSFALA